MSTSRPRRRHLRWAATVALGLLLTACAQNAPQDALKPEGPIARKQDRLWDLTFGIAAVIFVVVVGLIIFTVIRFRARSDDDTPKQVHGHPRLEITLTVLPAALLAFVAVPTVSTIFDLAERPPSDERLDVTVHGKLWWWELEYPKQNIRTANEMHIPVGRPVYLALESDNVIHSWWIPKLAGKRDVVPGRVNHMTIQADHPGTYLGQCAEFCGLSHANMRMRVIAHTAADFADWVRSQRKDAVTGQKGLAKAGQTLFMNRPNATQQCAGCHTVEGLEGATGRVGPNLTHIASRTTFAGGIFHRTPGNLGRWLRNPPGEKPGSKMPNLNLSEDEIRRLVAYLATLR